MAGRRCTLRPGKTTESVIELLLAKGADLNAKGEKAWTPLYVAIEHGQADIVELLLIKGADANGKDSEGFTPLHQAARTVIQTLANS